MRSLRRTALIWMAVVITGTGLVGTGTAYGVALSEANGFMDGQLRQIARSAGTTPVRRTLPLVRHDPEDDYVVDVWSRDGDLTQAGEHVAGLPRQMREGFTTLTAADTQWRVFTANDNGGKVQVAQQVEVRRELAEKAALQVVVPLLALVPVGCLVVGWAMGQALGDLDRLARQVERLPADSREPIDLAHVPSEAAPLVVAMNRLIERLRDSLTQQRKFLSDAAHELRTPLTALDLQINNFARAEAAATPGLLADLRQGSRRAATLIDQLLRMARLDAVADPADDETIDLGSVLLEAIADQVVLAESRAVDLGLQSSESVPLTGSARDLRILFGNIIDNPVKYTPRDGTVDVALERHDGAFSVTVSDTGPSIDPALLPRVFDRSFRAAGSIVDGSGLGLAVAQAIAARHGMTVAVANRTGRAGLDVIVRGRVEPPSAHAVRHRGKAVPPPSTASQT